MRTFIGAFLSLLAASMLLGQRRGLTIDLQTPEGQAIQRIGEEPDEAKKVAQLEEFVAKYPKYEGLVLVYGMMVTSYGKLSQFDKVMESGEKLLALDPLDARTAHLCLKAAEAKKDPDLVIKWSTKASEVARKVTATAKPAEEDAVEQWEQDVNFAKQLDLYTEYSLYATALQTNDPAKKILLVESLEQRNPQSQYLPQIASQYFLALRQTGKTEKAVAVAEKALEKDQSNEDMLLVVADYYMQKKEQPEKVLDYSAKLVSLMSSKPAPEGVSATDWQKKKDLTLGLGYWMTGVTYANQNKFGPADKALRQALPFIKGNEQLLASALFYLGLANYKLENILDAIKFNEQCIAIKSPYQARAAQNLKVIRSQYRLVRK